MRYRRLSYRYALLMTTRPGAALGDPRPGELTGVRFAEAFWRPPADVCESERAIEVTVDLAGIDQDALDVVLFEDALVIEGQRRLATAGPNGIYYRAEIRQGPFRLELALPATIAQHGIDARYDNGLLRITLPKLPAKAS